MPIGRTVNAGYAQAERGLESVGLVVDSLSDYLDKKANWHQCQEVVTLVPVCSNDALLPQENHSQPR